VHVLRLAWLQTGKSLPWPVAASCQAEINRYARLALWVYQKGAPLAAVCDADVQVRAWGAGLLVAPTSRGSLHGIEALPPAK
jgi:hypothetical protein